MLECCGHMGTQLDPDGSRDGVGFGISRSGWYILGELTRDEVLAVELVELMGVRPSGWLVRKGAPLPSSDLQIAPRTAIAVDTEGRLMLLVVNGEEDILSGMTLTELGTTLAELGAYHAINLDGGGSTTAVYKGKVVSHPTCDDTCVECERPVTTATCVLAGAASGVHNHQSSEAYPPLTELVCLRRTASA
eukprot:jgi/Mesvir1/1744/Mv21195-RA.1